MIVVQKIDLAEEKRAVKYSVAQEFQEKQSGKPRKHDRKESYQGRAVRESEETCRNCHETPSFLQRKNANCSQMFYLGI